MKITVSGVKKGSADLKKLGREIEARVAKMDQYGGKAVDMRDSVNKLLEEAQRLCADDAAFVAFKKKYCPRLGKSRTYELLAVEQGKKTIEQIRADTARRMRAMRARKANQPENNGDGINSSVTSGTESHGSDLPDDADDDNTSTPAPASDAGTARQLEDQMPTHNWTEEDYAAQIARDVEAEIANLEGEVADLDLVRELVLQKLTFAFKGDATPEPAPAKKRGRPRGSPNKLKEAAPLEPAPATGNEGNPEAEAETMQEKMAALSEAEESPPIAPQPDDGLGIPGSLRRAP
jgi:hypothetical protein